MLKIEDLASARHKQDWIKWSNECLINKQLFDQVIHILFYAEIYLARSAGEIIRYVFDKQPEKMQPFTNQMLQRVQQDLHPGIHRSILHCAQYMRIPEDESGAWFDVCLNLFIDTNKTIAVRVFAMTTCYNIVKDIPELYEELCHQIRHFLPNEGPGFKNRGEKILSRTWS